ncbi:MAG: hypothetical protein EA356_04550 [Geminicoccaceae bacterium]|nr:MAG: hypothetical protein EA356_04550 [Geminicoccaceae bacterium]
MLARTGAVDEPGFVLEPQRVAAGRFLADLRQDLPAITLPADAWERSLVGALAPLAERLTPEYLAAEVRDDGRTLHLEAYGVTALRAEALAERAAERLLGERLQERREALAERRQTVAQALAATLAELEAGEQRLALVDARGLRAAILERERREARVTRLEARLEAVERDLARTTVAVVEPLDVTWLQQRPRSAALAEALAARETALAQWRAVDAIYGDRHPLHAAARAEVEARSEAVQGAAAALLEAETAERDALLAELRAARARLEEARNEVSAREALALEQATLERAVARDLTRVAELEAEVERLDRRLLALLPDATVVGRSEAVPVDRLALQATLYGGAGVLGLVLGLCLGTWRARSRPGRYATRQALADDTGVPVLAAVAPLPRRVDRVARSRAAPAIERLWLQCDAAAVPPRSLVVTAPDRGVDTARLTAAMAAAGPGLGYTVLVIDAGAPAVPLHRLWRVQPGPGLAEVLSGAAAWTDVVVPLGERGPWLLRRGQDARAQAAPAAFDVLLQSAERRFDRILVAAPPLDGTAGLKLVRACRTGLVAVRAGVTRRRSLEAGLAEVGGIGGDLLGLVLVDASRRA